MSDGRPRAPKPLRRKSPSRSCHADAGARPVPQPQAAVPAPLRPPASRKRRGEFDELDERPVMTTAPTSTIRRWRMRQRWRPRSSSLHYFRERRRHRREHPARDARLGFNDSAVRAMRTLSSACHEDGKRVKTGCRSRSISNCGSAYRAGVHSIALILRPRCACRR